MKALGKNQFDSAKKMANSRDLKSPSQEETSLSKVCDVTLTETTKSFAYLVQQKKDLQTKRNDLSPF